MKKFFTKAINIILYPFIAFYEFVMSYIEIEVNAFIREFKRSFYETYLGIYR